MKLPLTVQETATALRAGQVSSVELTRALLARIEKLNPTLGAFICVIRDAALADAAAADALFASGTDRGPLQGIPYAAKDIIATKGAPTTANSKVLDPAWGTGWDATVISKLREAGAVLLGKTVLSEFAIGLPDPAMPFPMPQNPWDLPRSAAGSSSGTGIAVASGLALCGLGTDTGGSARTPASLNGHTGMKQTYGRVSKWGCVPLAYGLDSINPIARSAFDCALMLNVMAGYDPMDPCTVDLPVPDYTASLNGNIAGLRIGIPTKHFFDFPLLDGETKTAILAAVDVMQAAGAKVQEVDVPHAAEAMDANMIIMWSESFAYHRPDLATKYDVYGKYTSEVLGRGALLGSGDYVQAQRFRAYFRSQMRKLFETIDVLVTPTSLGPAGLRTEMNPEKQIANPTFTSQWNLAGLPAMALPCGFSGNMLPLSMQIIGKAFDEATVFRVGDAYQHLTDWHLRVPPIAALGHDRLSERVS